MTNFFRKCSFTAQDMASSRLTSGVTRVVSGIVPRQKLFGAEISMLAVYFKSDEFAVRFRKRPFIC